MTQFTDNPLERMMVQKPKGRSESIEPIVMLPQDHPCYGCGNAGEICVGICSRLLQKEVSKQ